MMEAGRIDHLESLVRISSQQLLRPLVSILARRCELFHSSLLRSGRSNILEESYYRKLALEDLRPLTPFH